MTKNVQNTTPAAGSEAWILAGGLSSRMGRDKSRLRLGGRTMAGHIRLTAKGRGLKARTLRRDSVARCGPVGGIYTALERSRTDTVLVLACDMPLVSADLLEALARTLRAGDAAVFVRANGRAGFPCVLRRELCLPSVRRQIERGEFSLQALARVLKARMMRWPRSRAGELANINTPQELAKARKAARLKPSAWPVQCT